MEDIIKNDKFILFGNASPDNKNAKYPIEVYNQSDDVFDAAAKGTAYFENNKLIYKIDEGGSDGGHNKLAFGYWDNPINLPEKAYYVITITIKASVELTCNVTLHDMNRAWGSSDEGILLRRVDFLDNSSPLSIGTKEQTFELITDAASDRANKCELLLEFGKTLGGKKDVVIEISELKIGYRTVAN